MLKRNEMVLMMLAGLLAGGLSLSVMAESATTPEQAKEIALAEAGVSPEEAFFEAVENGTEQGVAVYELEFHTDSMSYEYDVAAEDGEILKESWEVTFPVAEGETISEEEAREFALTYAGLEADKVTFTKVEKGMEDGIQVYELHFEDELQELECEVALSGGEVLSASRKVKTPKSLASGEKAPEKSGEDEAIEAALTHAGLTAKEVSHLKCEKDQDDGREIYEIEFVQGKYEYSYEVDAKDLTILEWEKEIAD